MELMSHSRRSAHVAPPPRTGRRLQVRFGLALLVSLLLVSGCGPVSISEEQRMERALQFEAAGDLRGAEIELKNLLQRNPSHGEARLRLGLLSLELGLFTAARMELRRAAELGQPRILVDPPLARVDLMEGKYTDVLQRLDPDAFEGESAFRRAQVLLLRGEALAGLGRTAEAADSIERSLELAPDYALAQVAMAALELQDGRVAEARTRLVDTLSAQPEVHQGWSLLGDLERAAGNLVDAEAAYSRVISHRTDGFEALMQRALVRMSLGDVDGMERDLATMQSLAPEEPRTVYIRGLVDFQRNRHAEAQSSFEEVLSTAPGYQPARFFLGATHLAEGRLRLAEHHLEEFLRETPQSADGARLLAQVRLRQGDPDRAESLLRRVLAQDPDDGQALRLMSAVHLERGDATGAIGHLQRLASLEPGDPAPRASIAELLLRAGEREQALSELRAAISRAPDDVGLRVALVVQLLQGSEYDSALDELKALREAQPGEPLPRTLTAGAYIGKGDLGRAREALLEGLQLAPGDPAASLTLAQLNVQAGNEEAAREQLRESLQHHPGDPRVSLRLAQLEAEAGDLEAMQAVLKAVVERHPAEVEPRVVLARHYLNRDEPRRALALLDPVEDRAADNPEMLYVLANAQIAAGMRAEAAATVRTLTEHAPDSADTRYRLGVTYEKAESPEDARRMYIAALELDANHPAALQSLGAMELREGRPSEAMVLARRMQGIEGVAAAGYLLEGRAHSTAGQHEDAVAAFEQAHARSPSPETMVALGLALQQVDRAGDAAEMLRTRLSQHPDETAVRLTLAQALLSLGENAAAIREYEDLVRTLPEHVAVLNNLAYLYHAEGEPRALEYAERAHAQAPNNPAVADTLGWILVEQGDVARGLPLLATAREALPELPDVRYHYAVGLAKAGREAEAQRELESLLEGFESFPQREDAQRLLDQIR